ncbi:MAG TPA: SUMF1/EgtB/PvdO family nonheme iron enzyme [Bryobacteraceae bacterium]|nr:SUMF1/EgtB/PvdO family nonheme iron enzyme [Bryobacteraceae bacterium]
MRISSLEEPPPEEPASGEPIAQGNLNFPAMQSLAHARALTDRLFEEVHRDAYYERPIPERHRILFYLGHLEAFDRNLIEQVREIPSISRELDRLFAFGIDPPPGQLPQDRPSEWPSLEQTRTYIRAARFIVDRCWETAPEEIRAMAIEHRLMHAETFTYILHNLPYRMRALDGECSPFCPAAPPIRMRRIPAGIAELGQKRGSFGWDNEFEYHQVPVPAFAIADRKVTNGDYLEFVKAGGEAPYYWIQRNGLWHYRGFLSEVPVPNDWPVYVSLRQAQAYAQWAGKSLPTEPQFHRAAEGCDPSDGNFDFRKRDLVSVSESPQFLGNGWEWTATPFQPFPGFEPLLAYPGYSANFFDGDHYVLKGGSCATSARLLRPSFRNWFRKDYPYAYSTFRLVED